MDLMQKIVKHIQFSILLETDELEMCKELSHNIENRLAHGLGIPTRREISPSAHGSATIRKHSPALSALLSRVSGT